MSQQQGQPRSEPGVRASDLQQKQRQVELEGQASGASASGAGYGASGSGLAVHEAAYHEIGKEKMGEKKQKMQAGTGMTSSQAAMRTKPDCGEESYVGHEKMKGKVALITGADSGIGRAVAIAFAREGAHVGLNYRSHDEDAEDTAGYIRRSGVRCLLLKGDCSQRGYCREMVERCRAELGGLHCVVANAGVQYTESPDLSDVDEARVQAVMGTNAYSAVWLAQAAFPHFGAGCTFIFNTSINASKGNASLITYSMSKGAQTALMRSLAQSMAEKGVRVNAVAPGPIWTPFIPGSFDESKMESFGEKPLLKRMGQPAECAPAFVYLACPDSSYVTGQVIHVDGGQGVGFS